MYLSVLMIHSWLRWLVFFALVYVLLRSAYGWLNRKSYTKHDNVASIVLLASTHLQVLIGFWLYFFLSPLTTLTPSSELFMKVPVLRYWKVEHLSMMLVFLIFIQLGRTLSKKSESDLKKHKRIAIFSILGFIVLMIAMPWPNRPYGRSLIPKATFLQKINI